MIKHTLQLVGMGIMLISLSSCTITPKQADNLELLFNIYDMLVEEEVDK